MQRKWMMLGAVLTMLSVAIGAFGAHMLKEKNWCRCHSRV